MPVKGEKIRTESGKTLECVKTLGLGGEGEALLVTDLRTGEEGVLKVLAPFFDRDVVAKRLEFIIGKDLSGLCPVLVSPIDIVKTEQFIGHYARYVDGMPLLKFVQAHSQTFVENLQLAIAISHAIAVLHDENIAHGDLHSDNVLVMRSGSSVRAFIIDFDNFYSPGLPTGMSVGNLYYMAPEIRRAFANGVATAPDLHSDRFSLGVLLHETILLLNFSAGVEQSPEELNKAMMSGYWIHDPANPHRPHDSFMGYPPEVLNAELARLFRRSASLAREERPHPREWEEALSRALFKVHSCPLCAKAFLVEASKTSCPHCGKPFPLLRVVTTSGFSLVVQGGAEVVGRTQLGSPKVSAQHSVLRRVGPETWLESRGRNGTYRWTGTEWKRAPDGSRILIRPGDRLRFADVEAHVEAV